MKYLQPRLPMTLSRKSAFYIHLTLSILIFLSLVTTMYLWWFPGELFLLDGGWQGVKLVAMVDLVLGPALTLLLYKPGKKHLLLDMSAIAALQVGALIYGFYSTFQQQTAALVFADNRFNTVSRAALIAAEVQLHEHGKSSQDPATLNAGRPAHVFTTPPDFEMMKVYLEDMLNGLPELHERSDLYLPLAAYHSVLRSRQLDQATLEREGHWTLVLNELEHHGHTPQDVELYRFTARYARGIAVFDPEKLEIIDYIPTDSGQQSLTFAEDQQ